MPTFGPTEGSNRPGAASSGLRVRNCFQLAECQPTQIDSDAPEDPGACFGDSYAYTLYSIL